MRPTQLSHMFFSQLKQVDNSEAIASLFHIEMLPTSTPSLPSAFNAPTSEIASHDYIQGSSDIAYVDELLTSRDQLVTRLHANLQRAQLRMKNQADTHRKDVPFVVGDWVFVKLQTYLQSSVARRQYNKLSKSYFGPFTIIGRIGLAAYSLEIPDHARIHNVFHVSLSKKYHGDHQAAPVSLPLTFHGSQPLLLHKQILGYHRVLQQDSWVPQILVH